MPYTVLAQLTNASKHDSFECSATKDFIPWSARNRYTDCDLTGDGYDLAYLGAGYNSAILLLPGFLAHFSSRRQHRLVTGSTEHQRIDFDTLISIKMFAEILSTYISPDGVKS